MISIEASSSLIEMRCLTLLIKGETIVMGKCYCGGLQKRKSAYCVKVPVTLHQSRYM